MRLPDWETFRVPDLITPLKFADRAIELFEQYREHFGLSTHEFPEDDPQEKQCEFEQRFAALICELKGHDIGPDQCLKPEHDVCYRCQELRVDIEK